MHVSKNDQIAGSHFVGVITCISLSTSKLSILVSDGYYTLPYEAEISDDRETTEGKLVELIQKGKLFEGMKVHFLHQRFVNLEEKSNDFFQQKL